MTSESDQREADTIDDAFSNPVLRTYLPSRQVYIPCLVMILGFGMIVGGPLTGSVLRRSTTQSIKQRQRIDDAKFCFHSQSGNQPCADAYTLSIQYFAVDNVDAVRAGGTPVLRETGPYTFKAIPIHGDVAFTDDRVQFIQRPMELTRACPSCEWSEEIEVLYNGELQTKTPEEMAEDLLWGSDVEVVLSAQSQSYRVIAYDGRPPSIRDAVYEAKVFGDDYVADNDVYFFDRWLETTVKMSPTSSVRYKGLDAMKLILQSCPSRIGSCVEAEWEVDGVKYTLPYSHSTNGTTLATSSSFSTDDAWEVVIDRHYGFTLGASRSYQANHRIDAYGTSYWAASHWMTVTTAATDDDIDFIKTTLNKTRMGYILLDLVTTMAGVVVVVLAAAVMCCTPAARRRLRIMALRAKSRARDPRLDTGQFTALGKFLRQQMKRKQTTPSSDSSSVLPLSTPSTERRDFDDVRSIPATSTPQA